MVNIFEQINGADLERLAECLKTIKAAGLSVDKYAQAGVNQSSGNVWVWSENWAGCVYCSIDFDVQWSWSCGNCGEEYDFDTYAEMQEFAEKQNEATVYEGCEHCCEVKETEEQE